MADEQNTETQPAPKTWTATLRRGRRYVYKGTVFLNGEDVDITDEDKAHLEEKAVDVVTMENEFDEDGHVATEPRAKFQFRKAGTEKPAPAPRRRARPAA